MFNTRKGISKKVEKILKFNGYNDIDAAALEASFKNSRVNRYLNDPITIETIDNVSRLYNVFNNLKWTGDIYNSNVCQTTMLGARISPMGSRLRYEFQEKKVEVIHGKSIPGTIRYDIEHRAVEKTKSKIDYKELLIFVLSEEGYSLGNAHPYFIKTVYIYIPKKSE